MTLKHILLLFIIFWPLISFSQNCSDVSMDVDSDYPYINVKEGLEMSFNSSWEISFEYQKAIVVFMQNNNQTANFGIMANTNGYLIKSAHELNLDVIYQLLNKMAPNVSEVTSLVVRS